MSVSSPQQRYEGKKQRRDRTGIWFMIPVGWRLKSKIQLISTADIYSDNLSLFFLKHHHLKLRQRRPLDLFFLRKWVLMYCCLWPFASAWPLLLSYNFWDNFTQDGQSVRTDGSWGWADQQTPPPRLRQADLSLSLTRDVQSTTSEHWITVLTFKASGQPVRRDRFPFHCEFNHPR